MRIRVLVNYGGALTREARIQPGEYDLNAPELHGAGQYLLDNGHAVVTAYDPPPAVVIEPEPIPALKPPDHRRKR